MRQQGTLEWLRGSSAAARVWWEKSLAEAKAMGMSYDLSMTHLEMGRRLRERAQLEKAEAVFAEIGAEWGLARAREALADLASEEGLFQLKPFQSTRPRGARRRDRVHLSPTSPVSIHAPARGATQTLLPCVS